MAANQALGEALTRLLATVDARAAAQADTSYTAQLLSAGTPTCARKLGEEAVELIVAALDGDAAGAVGEAADVMYHFAVLLKAARVDPAAVAAELARREGVSGLEEKASRGD